MYDVVLCAVFEGRIGAFIEIFEMLGVSYRGEICIEESFIVFYKTNR